MSEPHWPTIFALCVLIAFWIIFGLIFVFARRPKKAADTVETSRDPASRWGIAVQAVGFALVGGVRRRTFGPILPMPLWAEIIVAVAALMIAAVSVWLSLSSVRTLGKQWTYVARIIEGHKLVTEGPYSLVRNPIYLGMFGMLLATGILITPWWVLCPAAIIFLAGNRIRIRSEEKLLHQAFGAEFEAYTRRVPAMFPKIWR
jgi:protein-S-isoprenylcysteine O-methyltransferase Ste14